MAQTPLQEHRYTAEYLVSEARGSRSRDKVTIVTGQTGLLYAGTVLGKIAGSTSAPVSAANAGNTGNGTMGAVTPGAGAKVGVYNLIMGAATEFEVYDPNGDLVGEGHTGVAFSAGGLGFTLTAGGAAFVAGDGFTITVAANANAGKYTPLNLSAIDGSQNAAAILFGTVNAVSADAPATVTSREAEVNISELTWPSGITNNQIAAALAQLAALQIIGR